MAVDVAMMLKAPGTDSAKHLSVNMQFDKLNGLSVDVGVHSFAFSVEKYRLVNPWNRRDDSNEPAFPESTICVLV